MSDVKYVERDFPVGTEAIYYDKDYAKVQIHSFKKTDESQFFTDSGTKPTNAKTINWLAWTGYTTADAENKKAYEVFMRFNAPEIGTYRIECLYATTTGYNVDADVYVDDVKLQPVCRLGTYSMYSKRHYSKVEITKKGVHTLKFVMGFNSIWLSAIVKHQITYEADNNNEGNLTLLGGTVKKAEMLNVNEFTFNLMYDNSFKDPLPPENKNHNPSGLMLDYRDEVNFYVKTDEGDIKQIFGGYIQSIIPDTEKMNVEVTCADRMIDLDKKFTLTEMALLGGGEDYNGEYVTNQTLIDVESYTRAVQSLCNQVEETLQTNIPAGAMQLDNASFEDGFRMNFGETNRTQTNAKKYSIYNMIGKWLPQGAYLRNQPEVNHDQHFTFWDSSYYPEIEKNGLDLTDYPVFYIGYEMLEPKWEEETSAGSAEESQIWEDASKIAYGYGCSEHDPKTAFDTLSKGGISADCYGMTAYLYYRFNFQAGILARDVKTWGSGHSGTHHFIQLYQGGKWVTPKDGYKKLSGNFGISANTNENGTCIARAEPSKKGDINTMPSYIDCSFRGKNEGEVL